jgi:LPS export ABC transporter protein LptC
MRTKYKITALLLCLLLSGCYKQDSQLAESSGPSQQIKDLFLFETQNAENKWNLTASYAQITNNLEHISLAKPIIEFKEGKKTIARLKSKEGKVNFENKRIIFTKSVEAKSFQEKIQLNTEQLNYSYKSDKLWSNKRVTLKQHGVTVKGTGFEANSDLSEIVVKNQETVLREDS